MITRANHFKNHNIALKNHFSPLTTFISSALVGISQFINILNISLKSSFSFVVILESLAIDVSIVFHSSVFLSIFEEFFISSSTDTK
jgi:hypothetical protein